MVASFWIAAAYLGDIVTNSERGVAFGLLTTAMGLGFTVGPLLAGVVSDATSMRGAYAVAAGIGLIGVWIVLAVLQQPGTRGGRHRRPRISLRDSLRVGRDPALVAVGVANVLSGVIFGGAVATIFPLYAEDLGLSAGTIGTMFAVRALASTSVRLPSGALTGVLGSRQVVLGALVLETIAVAGIGTAESYGPLLLWLIVEGVGYGAFLASSQAYLAENTVEETRGAAIGLYSMTGGIGNTIGSPCSGSCCGRVGTRCGLLRCWWIDVGRHCRDWHRVVADTGGLGEPPNPPSPPSPRCGRGKGETTRTGGPEAVWPERVESVRPMSPRNGAGGGRR